MHHRKNDMSSAIEFCDSALTLHPTNIIALIIKADSIKFRSASTKQEEVGLYHQILSLDPQNALRFVGKGFLAIDNLGWLIRFRDLFFFYSQSYKSVNLDVLEHNSRKNDEELYNSFLYFGNIVFAEKKADQGAGSNIETSSEIYSSKPSPPKSSSQHKTIHRNYDKPWLQNAKKPTKSSKKKQTENETKSTTPTKPKRNYEKPWKQQQLKSPVDNTTFGKVEIVSNAPSTSKQSLYKLTDQIQANAPTITITSSINPNTMMKPKDTPFVSIINGKAIRFETLVQQLKEKEPKQYNTTVQKKQKDKKELLLKTSGSTLFEKELTVKRSPTPLVTKPVRKNISAKQTLIPNAVQLNSSIIPGSVEEVMNFEKEKSPAKHIVVSNDKISYSAPMLVT